MHFMLQPSNSSMMKKLPLLTALLIHFSLAAQTDLDAFRYSQRSVAGTARYISMGGAFTALGGDMTTLSHNPAGQGIYRGSEFTFSSSVFTGNSRSDYLGDNMTDGRTNFNIPNVGAVFTALQNNQTVNASGWISWNFGIAYNRLMDFHNVRSFEGYNTTSSLVDYFAQQANGIYPDNLDRFNEDLAYQTYLINPDSTLNYSSAAAGGNVLQRRSSETRGAISETSLTFSGNYSNKLYLGGSIGIVGLRYREDTYFDEVDTQNQHDSLQQYEYASFLNSEGSGLNLKFGFIYRASDLFRIGGAIHTPTWYNMSDAYSSTMASKFDKGKTYRYASPDGAFDYFYKSPFRAMLGAGFIFGKAGLLSVDYEFSDAGQSTVRADGYGFSQVNADIRRKYVGTHTLRAGTEWKLDNVSLRAGYGFTTSPISDGYKVAGSDFSQSRFSGGIGFREKNFFIDLGFLYSLTKEFTQPYTLENTYVPGSNDRVTGYNATVTVGLKF